MRLPHPRPVHRAKPALSTINPSPSARSGFTLIELIIVILVMLILMTLTVALVGNMLDSGRVSGAGRQIQNYLAGARDRAIYAASRADGAASPIGVRFLSDPSLMVPNPTAGGQPTFRGFSGMIFIQETPSSTVWLRTYESGGQWYASQLPLDTTTADPADTTFPAYDQGMPWVAAGELIERGLVNGRWEDPDSDSNFTAFYYLQATFKDAPDKNYYIRFPKSAPSLKEDPDGNFWLAQGELSASPPGSAGLTKWEVHPRPSPLPNEEPRLFPAGTIIEIRSSRAGGTPLPLKLNANGSFDVMFNGQGVVDGPLAAAGLIHLVVADLEDIERGFGIAGPFIDVDGTAGWDDADGDGEFDVRQGDVRIISLRTRTGSAYASDIKPVLKSDGSNLYDDPFFYAETGGEAK